MRISVCIDTAHIFTADYDVNRSGNYIKVMNEFDSITGFDRLKCIHMNDSKKESGSRVDRNGHIGKGYIGLEDFTNIMNDRKLLKVPKILETPKRPDLKEDLINIAVLKSLVKEQYSIIK